jgi:hypothetical protein
MTNSDTTPLRFVTDGRLLTLDVTPGDGDPEDGPRPAAQRKRPRAAVHCALPTDIRPSSDADNVHVLAPDATYVEEFDPRLYCFDAREAAALVPGARVVAHLGWAAGRGAARTPPFVADESFGADSRSGVKELTAEAVVTPEPMAIPEPEGGAAHKLVVTAPARIDAARGLDLLIDVAVENVTSRPIRLMLRPETLAFEVASPRGVHQCGWQRSPGAPIAEVFTEVLPHSKASTSVLLASVCPELTFRAPGLYTVYARIDTRRASGRSIGLSTFDGVVAASAPTLVRVRFPTRVVTR